MTDAQWKEIKDAYDLIMSSKIQKIEGNGWMIYRVTGSVIRIDIK